MTSITILEKMGSTTMPLYSRQPHGTRARYQQHLKDKEEACPDCLAANTYYKANLVPSDDAIYKHKLLNRASSRAMVRLKHLHRFDYEIILQEELRRVYKEEGIEGSSSA
jgi:hypothetical protein